MPIVDNAVYSDGVRVCTPTTLESTIEEVRNHGGIAWIDLYRPDHGEVAALAREFGLHHLAVDDTVAAHQRPKLERYGTTLFVVLRPARYLDSEERVEFGELHVFVGPEFVITIRHAEAPNLAAARSRLETSPDLLKLGPEAILYAVLDLVVDQYQPVVDGLENDIDEIEDQLFSGDPQVSLRIYTLSEEVIEFQRAIRNLPTILGALKQGFDKYNVVLELQRHLRDVEDHTLRIIDQVDAFRATLQNEVPQQKWTPGLCGLTGLR